MESAIIYTDGASRGNPGKAAIGIIILDESEKVIEEHSEAIGSFTNNEAEYRAIIKALDLAEKLKLKKIRLFSDSELVVRQLNGRYSVKKEHLKVLFERVKEKEKNLTEVSYANVPRENKFISRADAMCNAVLDKN